MAFLALLPAALLAVGCAPVRGQTATPPPIIVVVTVVATLTPTAAPSVTATAIPQIAAVASATASPVATATLTASPPPTVRPVHRPTATASSPTTTRMMPTPSPVGVTEEVSVASLATATAQPTPAASATLEPISPTATLPPAATAPPAAAPPPAASSLSPAPVAAAAPWISETTITIPTYNYEAAFVATAPEDPVFPYPRLDPARVGPPAPRAYRAIVLENGFVAVTILPELGGRIYRWVDKATGRHLLYENPVIKPTGWGNRGWWLAAGGIEWAFPLNEHGLNEYRPWQVSTGSTAYGLAVTVSDVESRTGLEVGATISLDAGHAWVTIQPWARNPTAEARPYQLWFNAMLALNGNHASGQTRFILPASEVIVHSTGDVGAPGSGSAMGWPIHGGRDMSLYGNWTGYLGFFAPNVAQGFTGVYDAAPDQGIVRVYNPGWPAGTKIFGPATLPPAMWTDDGSGYVELWSGATSSFWSDATLPPGETFSWTEQWYPVHGLGGLSFANRGAALRLVEAQGVVEARVAVPAAFEGRVVLLAGEQVVGEWPVTIYPGQVFRATWPRPAEVGGAARLRLVGGDGAIVAEYGL